jgi:acetylornithine deacetylase/succinyl-diaminopimelate desuccinylase-like protein
MDMLNAVSKATEYLNANRERFRQELFEWLRIPSISAQPVHVEDIRKAAEWACRRCRAAGLTVEIVETAGWPVVIGHNEPKAGRPTMLLYGHYDVQPEGDLALWGSGPFEPAVKDGMILARGSADDKGQVFCAIAAMEAWTKTAGSLPINVKVLIEGEEEVGSANLAAVVRKYKDRLACDYVVIHDGAQFGEGVPAVTSATKGLVYKEIVIRGPGKDLHSGGYGGAVANPANELARVIASFHDADARVTIPGFYDRVQEMSPAEIKMMNSLPYDEKEFLADVGSPKTYSEKGYSALHCRWARPTLDVNGIYGGYMKEGSSTIIPSFAGAKVSMRLVPQQRAEEISRLFDAAVGARVPDTVTMEIRTYAGCDPYLADLGSAGIAAAREAMKIGFGKEPVMMREGGSLPILPMFKAVLGADSLMLGYGQPNCNAHSPNEFFHIRDFEAGMRTTAALFGFLGSGV